MSEGNRVQGMVRSINQWRNMVPSAVAAGSAAQVEYALTDAKTDIEALWCKVAALEAENARLQSELATIRATLASTDVVSLPNDYPTTKMAEDRIRTLNERTLGGLAIIGRAETAEARLAEAMKVLEPFAEAAGEYFAQNFDAENSLASIRRSDGYRYHIKAGHLFAARRVREGEKVE